MSDKDIKEQADFCEELTKRVCEKVRKTDFKDYYNNKHYQTAQDIIRLRRELLALEHMMKNYYWSMEE